jgi:hypothetical protein
MLPYRVSFNLSLNSCINICSNYNPFSFDYKNDLYSYGSKYRKVLKQKHRLTGIVEDHHIIPKSFEKHPLISETKFPIHCSKNIKMMPSINNKLVSENILLHTSHYKYNLYIRDKLDEIYYTYNEDKQKNILELIHELNLKLNYRNNIPWN